MIHFLASIFISIYISTPFFYFLHYCILIFFILNSIFCTDFIFSCAIFTYISFFVSSSFFVFLFFFNLLRGSKFSLILVKRIFINKRTSLHPHYLNHKTGNSSTTFNTLLSTHIFLCFSDFLIFIWFSIFFLFVDQLLLVCFQLHSILHFYVQLLFTINFNSFVSFLGVSLFWSTTKTLGHTYFEHIFLFILFFLIFLLSFSSTRLNLKVLT